MRRRRSSTEAHQGLVPAHDPTPLTPEPAGVQPAQPVLDGARQPLFGLPVVLVNVRPIPADAVSKLV